LGLIKGILKETWSFFLGLLKQWLGYIFQAAGVVAAVVFSPYVQYGADIRQDVVIFIYAYIASVIILRIAFRDSRWSIQYARQFFRFVRWFLAVLASIIAPFVPGFLPFLTLPGIGIVPRLAISVLVLLLLLFVGAFLGLGELFEFVENEWVKGFQKRYATPHYEAILMGEEFEHHPKPPLTRRERFRNWWKERKRLLRRSLRKFRDP
jgi:hypothetical protein